MEDEVIEFPSPLIFLVNLDDGYSGKSRFVKDERGVLRKLFWKGLICWMISSKILFLFSWMVVRYTVLVEVWKMWKYTRSKEEMTWAFCKSSVESCRSLCYNNSVLRFEVKFRSSNVKSPSQDILEWIKSTSSTWQILTLTLIWLNASNAHPSSDFSGTLYALSSLNLYNPSFKVKSELKVESSNYTDSTFGRLPLRFLLGNVPYVADIRIMLNHNYSDFAQTIRVY